RQVAIYDLIEDNRFKLIGHDLGPYRLMLSTAEGRLLFDVHSEHRQRVMTIGLSMSPFRRILKDYFMICESYYKAIRRASPNQIETIDMARRRPHQPRQRIIYERSHEK